MNGKRICWLYLGISLQKSEFWTSFTKIVNAGPDFTIGQSSEYLPRCLNDLFLFCPPIFQAFLNTANKAVKKVKIGKQTKRLVQSTSGSLQSKEKKTLGMTQRWVSKYDPNPVQPKEPHGSNKVEQRSTSKDSSDERPTYNIFGFKDEDWQAQNHSKGLRRDPSEDGESKNSPRPSWGRRSRDRRRKNGKEYRKIKSLLELDVAFLLRACWKSKRGTRRTKIIYIENTSASFYFDREEAEKKVLKQIGLK